MGIGKKSTSFQEEVPKSRINIQYVKKTDGAQEVVELPLKLLLLGDYTFREDKTPLGERKKIAITQETFESVMKEQDLKVSMIVPDRISDDDDYDIKIDLDLDSLASFSPDAIVQNVPELRQMIMLRDLLKDLRSKVLTNRQFRLKLEAIVKDPKQVDSIMRELEPYAFRGVQDTETETEAEAEADEETEAESSDSSDEDSPE
jgi:type VI secretion system protein ImpB